MSGTRTVLLLFGLVRGARAGRAGAWVAEKVAVLGRGGSERLLLVIGVVLLVVRRRRAGGLGGTLAGGAALVVVALHGLEELFWGDG